MRSPPPVSASRLGLSALLCASLVSACAPTEQPSNDDHSDCQALTQGDVSSGATLSAGCYRVDESLSVSEGLLTLEAGAELRFAEGVGLTILPDARLSAVGSEDDPILLTAQDTDAPLYWRGLRLEGSDSDQNLLEHVVIEHGGASAYECGTAANLTLDQRGGQPASVTLRDVTLRASQGDGFCVADDSYFREIVRSTSTANAGNAGWVSVINLTRFPAAPDDANDFTGNAEDVVAVQGGEFEVGTAPAGDTVAPLNVPYRVVEADIMLHADTLQVLPGVTLQLEENRAFVVNNTGRLSAQGTEQAPIVFTSADPGLHWNGLAFWGSDSAENVLAHVVIENGGKNAYRDCEPANVCLTWQAGIGSMLQLDDTVVRGGMGAGIALSESTLSTCADVTFEDNAGPNVHLRADDNVSQSACP